jgi:hypothetical protein
LVRKKPGRENPRQTRGHSTFSTRQAPILGHADWPKILHQMPPRICYNSLRDPRGHMRRVRNSSVANNFGPATCARPFLHEARPPLFGNSKLSANSRQSGDARPRSLCVSAPLRETFREPEFCNLTLRRKLDPICNAACTKPPGFPGVPRNEV